MPADRTAQPEAPVTAGPPPVITDFWEPGGPIGLAHIGEAGRAACSACKCVPGIAWNPALPGVTLEIVRWTAAMAAAGLEAIRINRRQKTRKTDGYFRDMTTGNWPFAADAICFDDEGNQIDGEHRDEAIIKAAELAREAARLRGCTPDEIRAAGEEAGIYVVVARGLDKVVQRRKDRGAGRSAGDDLAIAGQADPYATASLARFVGGWAHAGERQLPGKGNVMLTDAEIEMIIGRYPGIPECAAWAKTARNSEDGKTLQVSARILGMALWLFGYSPGGDGKKRDLDTATWFMNRVVDGTRLEPGDQIAVLRRRFIRQGESRATPKLKPLEQLYLLLRAWRAWHSREAIDRYQLPAGGVTAASLPDELVYGGGHLAVDLDRAPSSGNGRVAPAAAFTAPA